MAAENPFEPAWRFLQEAGEYTDLEQLQDGFAKAVGEFGFDRFSCTLIGRPGVPLAPRVLFGRSHQGWDQYYMEQGYLKHDPCVRMVFTHTGPHAWSDIDASVLTKIANEIRAEAAGAGAREGFVVPVHGGGGEFYGVRLNTPENGFNPAARPTLHALATVYAVEGVKLLELSNDGQTETPLSRREAECLSWVAEGKSDWDISEIVGIAEATVHAHIENAKRKIGVRSRTQAAVIAAVKGWLWAQSPS